MSISFVLLLLSAVCFILATAGVDYSRVRLVPLGLAFWILSLLAVGR